MKLTLVILALMCTALFVEANEGIGEQITNEDLTELKAAYKDFSTSDGENAPIREMAQKTKDLTMKYFKTVGVEIAKHMCNQLDNILRSFNDNENKNEI